MIEFATYFGLIILVLAIDFLFSIFITWLWGDGNGIDMDEFFSVGFIFNILAFSIMTAIYIMEKIG